MDDTMNEDDIPRAKIVAKYEKCHARGIIGVWTFRFGGATGAITIAHDSSKLFVLHENRSEGTVGLDEKMVLLTWRKAVQTADVTPDGKYLIIVLMDGTVHEVILTNTVVTRSATYGYLEGVHGAIKPDMSGYIISAFSGTIKEVQMGSETVLRVEKYPSVKQTSCMKFSRNGKYLAIGHIDGGIEVFHSDTYKIYHKYEVHSMRIRKLEFLPADDRFLSGCDDHLIKLHSLTDFGFETDQTRSTKALRIYSAHDSPVTGLAIDLKSGGTRFASSSTSSQIFIWHIELTTPIMSVANEHTSAIRGLSFSPTSRHLLSGGDDSLLLIYSIPGVGEGTPEHTEIEYPQEQPSMEESYNQQENEPPSDYSQQASQNYYAAQEEGINNYHTEAAPPAQYQEYNPYAEPRTPPQEDDDLGDYVYNTTEQTKYEPASESSQNEYDPAA